MQNSIGREYRINYITTHNNNNNASTQDTWGKKTRKNEKSIRTFLPNFSPRHNTICQVPPEQRYAPATATTTKINTCIGKSNLCNSIDKMRIFYKISKY